VKAEQPVSVFITVDTEMWPVHRGNWPHEPLEATQWCEPEFCGYYFGGDSKQATGLPLQLAMLRRHGLSATFFVDPLFSFALGLAKLEKVVKIIEESGQTVALHLHPEWLTDPRCRELPVFRGPMLSEYSEDEQRALIRIGWQRLIDAGCNPVRAFRAGSWGADIQTLRILAQEGFTIDSSLNAAHPVSLPSLASRSELLVPTQVDGILEIPVTRFSDGVSDVGRPLSLVGVSASEMAFVLDACHRARHGSVTMVLHSNELTRTDRLWAGRAATPMRLVIRRFEKLCQFLDENRSRFQTRPIHQAAPNDATSSSAFELPRSSILRTAARWTGQLISRVY
jgi:hypothetical protein